MLHAHFFDLYSALSSNPNLRFSPQYPPLAMYVFGGCVALYHALAAVFALPAASYLHPSQALLAVMKLPAIACDLGVSGLIYWRARQRLAAKWALIAAASYAFAPAVVVDGAMWGQTDGVTMLPLLLALVCAQRRRGVWAGIALALAALFKPTALLFAPLLLVYLWRWAGPKEVARSFGAAVATGVVVCLPYLAPPHFDLLTYPHVLATSLSYYPVASPSAFNLWFALLIPGHPARTPYLGPLSPAVDRLRALRLLPGAGADPRLAQPLTGALLFLRGLRGAGVLRCDGAPARTLPVSGDRAVSAGGAL